MPVKLATTVKKIENIPNAINSSLLSDFYNYLNSNGVSESHISNNLKALTSFARFLGLSFTFTDISSNEPITNFLDSKLKSTQEDPDGKSIITWDDYLGRIKYFFRWLHNCRGKYPPIDPSDWQTPAFLKIKKKKSNRQSPYSESELWEQDDILSIVKYEPYKRNKAALTLFWDLDARNHEVTRLKIKHIHFKERYGEGQIPYNTKTGGGPILLTSSFPYVRDWLNEHPYRNELEARLICNLSNGSPVKPDAMWTMMKQLKKRVIHLLENGTITDENERKKLEYLLKTKKWNTHPNPSYDQDHLHW
jgi:integrase/recombinase XerD